MDPYIHTLIATGMVAIAYYTGWHFGTKQGHKEIVGHLMNVWKAVDMEIAEDGEISILTEDGDIKSVYPN